MHHSFVLLLLVCTTFHLPAQPNYPLQAEGAQLIYTDLEHFLEAYQQLSPDKDTLAVLREYYFDRGTAGLQEYTGRHGLTPERLRDAMAASPEDYAALAGFVADMEAFRTQFMALMSDYQEAVPTAMFPPTYLLVGANRGIAQASRPGQLVTVIRNIQKPTHQDRLLTVIAHELTHFQQARSLGYGEYIGTYSKENNMLDLVLREGGAEFVAYYLVRKNVDSYDRLTYLNERLPELKVRFREDLARQDATYWMWDSIGQDERPILLGYTMGYKICEAYYGQSEDKAAALKQILGISDAESFLAQSGFLEEQ